MTPITSLQNTRVKAAIKLRDRKGRDKQSRILIDGLREIGHAHAAGVEFKEVFTCESLIDSPESHRMLSEIEQSGFERLEVSPQVWEKLTFGNRQDGLLVVATPPRFELADIPRPSRPLIVILDGVEKPGNVGAVIRSADGAGASAVVLTNSATDVFNPNAIRASIGTIFRMPIVSASVSETIEWLRQKSILIFLSVVGGDTVVYTEWEYTMSAALVFGSEAHGVCDEWKNLKGKYSMHLPMRGEADSLNVSAAATAVLYEVVRQRSVD